MSSWAPSTTAQRKKNFQKSIDPWVLLFSSNLLFLMSFLNIWPRTWKQTLEQEEIRPLKCQLTSAMQGLADKDPGFHVVDASSQGPPATLSEATLTLLGHHGAGDRTEQWSVVGVSPQMVESRKGAVGSLSLGRACTWSFLFLPLGVLQAGTGYLTWGSGLAFPGVGRWERNMLSVRVQPLMAKRSGFGSWAWFLLDEWLTACT